MDVMDEKVQEAAKTQDATTVEAVTSPLGGREVAKLSSIEEVRRKSAEDRKSVV